MNPGGDSKDTPSNGDDGTGDLHLTGSQTLVGVVQHAVTGAFVVFLSLDGDDIRQIAVHTSEAKAQTLRQEIESAVQSLLAERIQNSDADSEEAAVQEWVRLLDSWTGLSDAPLIPFSQGQLQSLGQSIQEALRQRQSLPPLAPGTSRVTLFVPGKPPEATSSPLPFGPMTNRPYRRKRRRER